jgi:hypothetical protein
MNNKDEFTIDSLKILGLNPLFFIEKDSMKARGIHVIE